MFQGMERKDIDCCRCMQKDAWRRFLDNEGDEQAEFGEIDVNSRRPSPERYGKNLDNFAKETMSTFQQENECPPHIPIIGDSWMETKNVCKRCLYHHKVHNLKMESSKKMEHPIEQPLPFERREYKTQAPPRKASPKGENWTPDIMRGLGKHSTSQKGGRYVLSPSQCFKDKWKEENLSLRFSDPPVTKCAHCLQHHGFEPPQPNPYQQLLERVLSSFPSKEYLEAKETLHKGSDGGWWAKAKEEHSCRRCSSHHINHEGLLKFNDEIERITKVLSTLRAQVGERTTSRKQHMPLGNSRHSSPEFSTPPNEFKRSRTPTPQRSYRELHERKIQVGSYANNSPNFEIQQLWKPSRKMTKYDITEYLHQCRLPIIQQKYEDSRRVSPIPWTSHEMRIRKQNSPSNFPQRSTSPKMKGTQLMVQNVKRYVESGLKSPKWSKECLHKRELRRRHMNKEVVDIVATQEKGCVKDGINYGRMFVGQSQSPTNGHEKMLTGRMFLPKSEMGNSRRGMAHMSQALPVTSNLTKESKYIIRSKSQHEDERRAKRSEEKESCWPPPPKWTTRQLNLTEVKNRSISPNKFFRVDRKLLQTKTEDLQENFNLETYNKFGYAAKKLTSSSKEFSPCRLKPIETCSKEPKHAHLTQEESKSNVDYKFEVINMETKEFEERNPNSSIPNLCRTRHSSPSPKHVFLRIPTCNTNNLDKDQKISTHVPNSKTREKYIMSKKKFHKDMKLRVEIRSELPLDIVDGRLKQFLKGVGGLIYYSPKDGGVPRIKELANYFSRKQPLLWFFPRST